MANMGKRSLTLGQRSKVCKRCGRLLKNEASQKLGFGKKCYQKYLRSRYMTPLFEMKIQKKKKRGGANANH